MSITLKKRSYRIKSNTTSLHLHEHAFTNEFYELKKISSYTNEALAELVGVTHRTVQNKKNKRESFDIAQTERLRKIHQLFEQGNKIFGTSQQFNAWLHQPAYGLDNLIPVTLLKIPGGVDHVLHELNAIKFGDTI